jgi:hypothetical protein
MAKNKLHMKIATTGKIAVTVKVNTAGKLSTKGKIAPAASFLNAKVYNNYI